MSLDVYLTTEPQHGYCRCACGHEHIAVEAVELFSANITHNLNKMADAAGIYGAVWRPEENGIERAGQLVPILEAGLALLDAEPERFKAYNSPNGWGLYENFVPWLRNYLEACRENPTALVRASR